MKLKDIQVGEKYQVGYGGGAEVLEVRVPRTTYRGTARQDGVRLRYFTPAYRAGNEAVLPSSSLRGLWSDYETQVKEREQQQQVIARERDRISGLVEQLVQTLQAAGIEANASAVGRYDSGGLLQHQGHISLDEEQLVALLNLLGAKTPQAEPQPASTTALGTLLG